MTREPVTPRQAAWSWTEHLRHGGTAPWSAWVAASGNAGAGRHDAVPAGWRIPGAAQLELVRRLAGRPSASRLVAAGTFPRLADVVLARSAPGRGMAPAPLAWPAGAAAALQRQVGAPPADPAGLPRAELLRVGVGALAELLVRGVGTPAVPRSPRRHPFAAAFRLEGAPVTAAAVRRTLAGAGHVEGGRSPEVVLLAEPLDVALGQVWSARVQDGTPVRWRGFLDRASHRRELPAAVDYPALARLWTPRVGAHRVHVVVAPEDPVSTTARLLDLPARPRRTGRRPPPQWQHLSAEAVDVLRRVNAVLGIRLPGPRHRDAVRRLAGLLAQADSPHPMTVPEPHLPWVARRAEEVVEAVREGGYAVHGDLGRLVPVRSDAPAGPRRRAELELVLDGCLRLAALDVAGGRRSSGERG